MQNCVGIIFLIAVSKWYSIFIQVLICLEIMANGDLRSHLQGLDIRYMDAGSYFVLLKREVGNFV